MPTDTQVYPICWAEDASHDARKSAMEVELVEWEEGKPIYPSIDSSSQDMKGHILGYSLLTVFETVSAHG